MLHSSQSWAQCTHRCGPCTSQRHFCDLHPCYKTPQSAHLRGRIVFQFQCGLPSWCIVLGALIRRQTPLRSQCVCRSLNRYGGARMCLHGVVISHVHRFLPLNRRLKGSLLHTVYRIRFPCKDELPIKILKMPFRETLHGMLLSFSAKHLSSPNPHHAASQTPSAGQGVVALQFTLSTR